MADKLKNAILRGQRTAEWYEKPIIQQIFAELRADIKELWSQTPSSDEDERERLYRQVHGLDMLQSRILEIIRTGKKAQIELDSRGDDGKRD